MNRVFLCHNPQFSPLSEIAFLCRRHGYGIELSAFTDIDAIDDPNKINFYQRGIKGISDRSIHGPYLDLYPGSPDKLMRKKTFDRFQEVCRTANKVNASHIVFHHNYASSIAAPEQWLDYSRRFWHEYLKSNAHGIQIHLENIMDETPELLLEVVRQTDNSNLSIALDIGHVHVYSKMTLVQWIECLKDRIGYVHLHDNDSRADDHFGLGKGTISLIETLEALRCYAPHAVWALESGGTELYRSLQWLAEYDSAAQVKSTC